MIFSSSNRPLFEILLPADPIEELWDTINVLMSKRYHYITKKALQDLISSFISQYCEFDINQKKIVLIKLATNKYTKLENLKKKISEIKNTECLMSDEQELEKIFDPPCNWFFATVSQDSEKGFKTLQNIETALLNMFLDMSKMSNIQKIAIKTMKNHITHLLKSIKEKEVTNVSTTTV